MFDVDGVIIDVRDSYHRAVQETLKHYTGALLPLERIREFKFSRGINNDWDLTVALIRELGYEPPPYDELVEVFEAYYDEFKEHEKLLLPRELFETLKEEGFTLGVVTGRPLRDLSYAFDRFKLWEFFDAVVCEDDVPAPELRKPHPFPLHACVEALGAEGGVYVGDQRADAEMVLSYRKLYGKDVKFLHYAVVLPEELPAHFRAASPEELLRIARLEAGPAPG
ncbi:MAG: HAD hydrolase-like protein [Aquificae bacterium]|nr:HAD hydrolase-like protein [Aquificota bacterium]